MTFMKNHLVSISRQKFAQYIARWFFFVCITSGIAPAKAQSFHYFRYQIPDSAKTSYVAFLTVFTDGTATARVRNAASSAATGSIFEMNLSDTLILQNESGPSGKKQLYPHEIYDIKFMEEFIAFTPLFEFSREAGTGLPFYAPTGIRYLQDGKWMPAKILENKSYSYAEVKTTMVKEFYNEAEPYYKEYFLDLPSAGLATRSLNTKQKKTKIWMIVVTNTNDETVGKSSMRDKETIAYTFTNIAEKMGLQKPVITYIWGKLYSKAAVEKALAAVKPGPDDVVVFYYSGHGFRQPADKSRTPNMLLSNSYTESTLLANSLNLEWVAGQLSKKPARFNLVISDCCNEELLLPPPVGKEPLITKKAIGLPISTDNFVKLFIEPKGTIIASASDINQFSVGNPALGGFFTYHFRLSLEYYISRYQRNVSWDNIFLLAGKNASIQATTAKCGRTVRSTCIQHPWYRADF
jgi:hypothetical protein